MIQAILSIIGSLFWAAGKLFDLLYAKRLVDAGKTAHYVDSLKEQIDAAQKALAARLDAERALTNNPDRVRDDDGFRRPDGE